MGNRRIALQFPTSMFLCQAMPLAVQFIRNQPNVLLKRGQKLRVTKHVRGRWCWRSVRPNCSTFGKSWPDLLEIGIVFSAALVAGISRWARLGSRRERQNAKVSLKQIKYQKAAGSFETAWLLFWQRRKASH